MRSLVEMPTGLRVFAGAAEGLAALGLVLITIGAIVRHLPRRELPNIALSLVLLAMAAVVAYVRWPALAM
jgi:hypothetical protein